jgi:hypothetical protein
MGNTCGNGSQSCDLRFAGADARAWADAAERRLGGGHTKVVKQVLISLRRLTSRSNTVVRFAEIPDIMVLTLKS